MPDGQPGAAPAMTLRVCALYPDLMNIYADRGNLLMLERDAGALFYIGGGQDRDQRLCAEDLIETKREALHAAAARGAVVLGVCGGYQLLRRSYTPGGERNSR